jgi:hypothetical protein
MEIHMQRQQSGKYASGMTSNRACVAFLMAIALLITACAKAPPPEATAAAEQFIHAYFVEDNMAGAAKLASGAAKARLDGLLQQIEAAGVKEPPKEKPKVKTTLVEPPSIAGDSIGYVYRIDSETAGIQPITAKLRLVKEGGAWAVSEFSQTP